jgi:hypothetical protein
MKEPFHRDPSDIGQIARALGRNNGWRVFPVKLIFLPDGTTKKQPQILKWQERASADPAVIARMWKARPGDLIGILCDERSGISVIDVDSKKHITARAWWRVNEQRMPITRTYRSQSGGFHLYFQHRDNIGTNAAKLTDGIDVRAGGTGFIAFWFGFGCECLDHAPLAPFPSWLHHELTWKPPAPPRADRTVNPNRVIEGAIRHLEGAREGNRNGCLFWAACRLVEHGMRHNASLAALLPAALSIGLCDREARLTIASAQGRESRRAAA